LTQAELKNQHGDTEEHQAQGVGNQEASASVLEAEIGESPQVAQADSAADGGYNEGEVGGPAIAVLLSVSHSKNFLDNIDKFKLRQI
jgi:hypothetical protein